MKESKKIKSSLQLITIFILISLIVINTLWVLLSDFSGPIIGILFYIIITFLLWKKEDYTAAIFAGILGFCIHLYELIFFGFVKSEDVFSIFLYLNLLLPLLLLYFGYKAKKKLKK